MPFAADTIFRSTLIELKRSIKRIAFPFLTSVIIAGCQPAQQEAPNQSQTIAAGDSAFHRGDYATALKILTDPTNAGHHLAQLLVGLMYWEGLGVPKDGPAAMLLFLLSAAQGDARSMNVIGYSYNHGIGVAPDIAQTVKWYRMAADRGERRALNNLGLLYWKGIGVAKDSVVAGGLWLKAAEQGEPNGMNNYGFALDMGSGVKRDVAQALVWYARAAELGQPNAMHNMAGHYFRGGNVQRDPTQAFYFASLAQRFYPPGSQRDQVAQARDAAGQLISADERLAIEKRALDFKIKPMPNLLPPPKAKPPAPPSDSVGDGAV